MCQNFILKNNEANILEGGIITACISLTDSFLFQKSGSASGSDSEASVVLEMNEKLLEAHKKVVQNKLSREVARTIFDSDADGHHDKSVSSPRINNPSALPKLVGSHNRRGFAPHLEGIPEESRANTLTAKSNDSHSDRATNDGNTDEVEREINESRKESTVPSQMKKLSTSDPQSLDSGILTRPSSISDLSDTQTDVVTSNSCDFDTDNETVDVADSDDTDTDSDTYVESSIRSAAPKLPVRNFEHSRQKKDFVSELYNTAVSKVPKVIPSDSESLYSSNSTIRKEFEYDSLDINSNCRLKDLYTNPGLRTRQSVPEDKDDYELVNVKGRDARDNVAEVYVNNEYDASTLESGAGEDSDPGYEYSAGEKMMISISGDNESVYSNKLLISVNSSHVPSKFSSADVNFDPDTLERIQKGEGHGSKDSHDVSTVRLDSYAHEPATTKSSFFLFRDSERRASNPPLSSLPPYSSPAPRKPSLPPKTRSTPRLPPKPSPGQKPRVNQRPLPPPPPPPPK